MIDLSTWITAIASAISAWAAYAIWRVSRNTLNLQASVEDAKKPLVHIWYNGIPRSDLGHIQTFTMVNIGGSAMPIRTLRVLYGPEKTSQSTHISAYTIEGKEKHLIGRQQIKNQMTDLILVPNQICFVEAECNSGQLRFEVMYYDNSFEFLEIDTSYLGGKYVLTGKGQKP